MSPDHQMVYRFLNNPLHTQLEIVTEVGLLEPGDMRLSAGEWNRAVFTRACERGLVEQLRVAVDRAHERRYS